MASFKSEEVIVFELPISDEAVEKATRANVEGGPNESRGDWDNMQERNKQTWREGVRVGIQAFLEAEGFEILKNPMRDEYRLMSSWKSDQ